ncbi:acid protease [Lichtheimia hyalospora FSU 10163]|nr:acid protease [Lichtheimia hyalospora FSU 10163]
MRIPLYRRTDSGIVTAAGEALDNGVLAGKVYIGNPPQEFTMAFDTNTGYSWVRGSRCKSENCLDRCTYYARRSDSVVSTGEKFSVEYGDACVDTHVYLDTLEFNGIKVENMPFGGAYRMSGFDDGFDGYLGLGRSVDFNKTKIYSSSSGHLAKRADLPSSAFVTNAYQSGSVESAQFGMVTQNTDGMHNGGFGFIKRHNTKQPDGYLILGGVDKSLLEGDMEYIPLADVPEGSTKNWDVCIKDANFEYNLNIKQKPNAIASISTANGFITMPSDQADIFQEVFGLKLYHSTNTYGIKCSEVKNLPTLKLTLENHIVELPPKYWIREIDADRDCCATRIRKGDSERDWILGTPFTNAFYTSFDPDTESVGLGIIKGHKDDGLRIYQKTIHKKDD